MTDVSMVSLSQLGLSSLYLTYHECTALSTYYGSVLPEPSSSTSATKPGILDVASSWISHLPEFWSPANIEIVGIGMNEPELAKNRALSRYIVLDLNKDPQGLSKALSSETAKKFDGAVCSVSIDYLVQPREMLADLATILKKDAGVHLAFSNRCFPSKASHLQEQHPSTVPHTLFIAGRWALASHQRR